MCSLIRLKLLSTKSNLKTKEAQKQHNNFHLICRILYVISHRRITIKITKLHLTYNSRVSLLLSATQFENFSIISIIKTQTLYYILFACIHYVLTIYLYIDLVRNI